MGVGEGLEGVLQGHISRLISRQIKYTVRKSLSEVPERLLCSPKQSDFGDVSDVTVVS